MSFASKKIPDKIESAEIMEREDDITKIFAVFSTKSKRDILELLRDDVPLRLTDISDRIGLSKPLTKMHLDSLNEMGIVRKTQRNQFVVTGQGVTLLTRLELIKRISENVGFYCNHSLGDIPEFLIERLTAIRHSTLIPRLTDVFVSLETIVKECKSFFYCVVSQPPFIVTESLALKLKDDIKLGVILGKNSIGFENTDFFHTLGVTTNTSQESFERRLVERVSVNVFVTEKRGAIMLPFSNGDTIDTSSMLTSTDSRFIEWCLDFYRHKRKDSQPFSRTPRCDVS